MRSKPRIFKYPKCPICKHHHKVPDKTKGESELAYCWIRGIASVVPKPKLTTRMVSSECPNCGSHKTKSNEGKRFFENQVDYLCSECGCQWYIRKVITNQIEMSEKIDMKKYIQFKTYIFFEGERIRKGLNWKVRVMKNERRGRY